MAGLTSALGAMQQSSADSGDEDTASMLSILLSRIDRMSRFITDYASMARIPDPVCRPVDANSFLRRTAPFLESLKGRRQIAVVLDLNDNAGEVSIDPVLMEQVLTNIVKNAVEAFPPDSSDCRITITSKPGYWCIADNGTPIPEEAARNLFTPFFSTKPPDCHPRDTHPLRHPLQSRHRSRRPHPLRALLPLIHPVHILPSTPASQISRPQQVNRNQARHLRYSAPVHLRDVRASFMPTNCLIINTFTSHADGFRDLLSPRNPPRRFAARCLSIHYAKYRCPHFPFT